MIEISKKNFNLAIIGDITFVGDSSRGILFPVIWPLCQRLGGNTADLGYLVASFPFGRMIVTTPLGYFCDVYKHRYFSLP